MLSAEKIDMPVSSKLDEQGMRHKEKAEPETKNDFSEQDVVFPQAVQTSLHVLGEYIAGLQTFSKRLDKEIPGSILHTDLFMPLRVLIVDDMPVNQRILRRILGKQHDCKFASNGKEAIEKYTENTFDIIFMDIQMPLMDGLEATTTIRQQELAKSKKRTPIIASTAIGSSALDKGITVAAGMDGYIMKPYDAKRIREIIHLYTGNGEKSCAENVNDRDEMLTMSTFSTRKILQNSPSGRRASSPEVLTSVTANSLVVSSSKAYASASDLSHRVRMPTKNPEGLSESLRSIPLDGKSLLTRYHLFHRKNRGRLPQGLLSKADAKWRQSPWRKSF
jgi:CheY-like chemotaxis protein